MTVTGITYRFSTLSRTMERTLEADIRLTGEDLVITETVRSTMETEVRRYGFSRETADEFLALIERFNVTSWAGKTPSSPKTADAGSTCTVSFLTLRSDDGSSADITFRETDETTGNEAAEAFRKLYFSTVRNADNIVVLDGGRIVESGTHSELIARKGAYYQLVKNQLELGN